jgi:uncharacterized membrane protein YhhN
MRRLLLGLSIVFSLTYLALLLSPNIALSARLGSSTEIDVTNLIKSAAIFCLLVYAIAANAPRKLTAALLFSGAGDFLLGGHLGRITPDKLFLYGLLAFLGAHLCYISLFYPNRNPEPLSNARKVAIAVVILALGVMLQSLWPSLGSMRFAVLVYALALDTMAITAIASRFPGIVAIGALLFVASDSVLAWDHFANSLPAFGPLIWLSYYTAQLLITFGVLRVRIPS